MPAQLADNFWPRPLRHCALPLVSDTDEAITIAELTSEPIDGFAGNRMLYTALVPLAEVDSVLKAAGGMGHGVSSNATYPAFGEGGKYLPAFWIDSPDGSKRFESLIHAWHNNNKNVLLPDSSLLMCYGLTPRIMKDGNISWDDPSGPVYDVVRVAPLSNYTVEMEYTTARVTIHRDYLEDYLSLKGCAAVVTYYDERYSSDDPEVAALVGDRGASFRQAGRELWFMPMHLDYANQVSQVWGCALLLIPAGRPISNPPELELTWPDRALPIKGSGIQVSFEPFELAYVRDEVLAEYEKRDEFEISPEFGFVRYGNWWSVSYCRRFGRNHIELELRKLYEGAPIDVIKHFNRFAVKSTVAEKDTEIYGTRHIGIRAKELVEAFLQVTATLSQLGDAIGLAFGQEDIGKFSATDITYRGWWTFGNLKSLGQVVPLALTFPEFLNRCKEVFKLLENLQQAALRPILIRLGLKKEGIAAFAGIKLLATICQLATVSTEGGFDLVSDCGHISSSWDSTRIIADLQPLFALSTLRNADAHNPSTSLPTKISRELEVFGIDEAQCRMGWGEALDRVYDRTALSLNNIDKLVGESWRRDH